jgi:CheY-like chemotaxis protein
VIQARDVDKSANGHILVAEDDHIVQLVVKKMLEQAGYKADIVNDGKEALSALASNHYDLVLMDCFMPRMDGFEATRLIRSAASSAGINPGIPVIALTGLTEKEDQALCLDAGMNHYVSKPVDSYTLIAAIEQCLGKAEDKESAASQKDIKAEQIWDDGFLNTMIDKFLAEVPQVVNDLQGAIRQGDTQSLQNIAHRLRGAADILEVSTLSARSKDLEQAGKAGDSILASQLASELIKDLQKLAAALAGS